MSFLEPWKDVIGTLAGTVIGSALTLWAESIRRRHDKENDYRKEIRSHMNDLIKPLFGLLQNYWGSLAQLQLTLRHTDNVERKGYVLAALTEVKKRRSELNDFIHSKYDDLSLFLPNPFPWVFVPLDELVESRIINKVSENKEPQKEITMAINQLMKIQKDLRRLIGFEVNIKMETKWPFEQ